MTFCLQMRNLFVEAITLSVISLLVASVTVANKCRTRMNNNETFEIKVSRTATKKVHTLPYLNLTRQYSEKQSLKSL